MIGVTDDIIVHVEDMKELDKNLKALLKKNRKVVFCLNKVKADLRKTEIAFPGPLSTR